VAVPPLLPEHGLFDEAGYFRLYPDIAQAVAAGEAASGWLHYLAFGRHQGRRPNDVDAAFYLGAYPQAAADIAAGRAADAASHYVLLGRARGYRPCRAAPAVDAAAMPPTFPWLWTDLPHASDLIEGRLELGRLTERQAWLLRHWLRDGFLLLDQSLDPRVVAAAALDLERAFAGACPDLLFGCGAVALGPVAWQPEMNAYPAAALDIHYVSHAVRALLFAEPVAELLGLIFDTPALLAFSRGVLRDAAQAPHTDAGGASCTLPRQFITAWFMLDDAAVDPGDVQCFPGSHRLHVAPGGELERRLNEHTAQPQPIAGRRGAVVLRHPGVFHSAGGVPEGRTRRGILARYCPHYVAPLFAERSATRIWRHAAHRFTTQYYSAIDPLD
jgi:Phytanoyl-CoA dioxygenase (PhyH)